MQSYEPSRIDYPYARRLGADALAKATRTGRATVTDIDSDKTCDYGTGGHHARL